ncbi:hypothetical protein OCU04_003358 [Sclerotinia nivalis]|uniref:Uncharacterized protein n=1 Tax=Sclerotinia nivalis TaxID=352851 RepID=A0A9X0ART9_9HELO|nr:hypothetical protein OCU04_003358 [Sclerotinia nivalis]
MNAAPSFSSSGVQDSPSEDIQAQSSQAQDCQTEDSQAQGSQAQGSQAQGSQAQDPQTEDIPANIAEFLSPIQNVWNNIIAKIKIIKGILEDVAREKEDVLFGYWVLIRVSLDGLWVLEILFENRGRTGWLVWGFVG